MKLPKKAKKVFTGKIYDVYQWPQKMFDGRTDTFEMLKRVSTVIVLAEVNGKIIIQKQKQPHTKWFMCAVAGRMDKKGESPKQAALRELLEETGYTPKAIKLIKTLNPSHKMDHTVYIFVARNCKKVADLDLDGGEKIVNSLYTFERFLKLWQNEHFLDGDIKDMIMRANLDKTYQKQLKALLIG